MFKIVKEKLQVKVMLSLFIFIGIAMTSIILVATNRQTKYSIEQMQRLMGDMGKIVYASMKYPMKTGDEGITARFLKDVATHVKMEVAVCDSTQKIIYSTNENLKGAQVAQLVKNKEGLSALAQGLKDGIDIEKIFHETVQNEHYVSMIKLIKNEPACYHCHGSSKPVLGAILVKKPVTATYAAITSSRNQNILIGVVGSIIVIMLIYFILRKSVIKPVSILTEKAETMAQGDITVEVPIQSEDEIGKLSVSFNNMAKQLRHLLEQVSAASEQIDTASSEVAASSQQLAEGSSEQAASLEESSASMEEIASMAKQNADNALQTDQLMKETQQITKETEVSIKELAKSMEDMAKLSEETQKIVKSIDEIAFQTNLLALNAAVEAARAGEAGQGFAVVADEVRNLAQRTATSAKDTAELIEQTVKGIKANLELVKKVDVNFDKVEESSGKVANLVAEISAASQEQTQGISEINKAFSQIDKATQQVASNAEELASASEEMKSQVKSLMELLGHFKFNGRKVGYVTPKLQGAEKKELPKPEKALPKKEKKEEKEVKPGEVIPLDKEKF